MLNSQWVLAQSTSLIGQCICLLVLISKRQPKLRKVNTGYILKLMTRDDCIWDYPKSTKRTNSGNIFYHLEKTACMFAEAHCTMFGHSTCCLCVHVPLASGIHNAASDAAAGTSKHAHSPQPAVT